MGCGVVERHLEMAKATKKPKNRSNLDLIGRLQNARLDIIFFYQITLTIGGMITVQLVSRLTRLDLTNTKNVVICVAV